MFLIGLGAVRGRDSTAAELFMLGGHTHCFEGCTLGQFECCSGGNHMLLFTMCHLFEVPISKGYWFAEWLCILLGSL